MTLIFLIIITSFLRQAFMPELCNPQEMYCSSWPRFAQTATDPPRERWLQRIIKAPCSPERQRNMRVLLGEQICILHQWAASVERTCRCVGATTTGLIGVGRWRSCFYPAYRISWMSWRFHERMYFSEVLILFTGAFELFIYCNPQWPKCVQYADRYITNVLKPFKEVWKEHQLS